MLIIQVRRGADVAATLLRQAAQHVERAARMRTGDSLIDQEIRR